MQEVYLEMCREMEWAFTTISSQDPTILIDNRLESNHPDIIHVHKNSHKCIRIDVAVSWDKDIVKAKQMKIQRYQELVG